MMKTQSKAKEGDGQVSGVTRQDVIAVTARATLM
jgi:hypothetical protein